MEPNRYIYGSAAPKLPEQPLKEERQVRRPPEKRKAVIAMPEPVKYPMGGMVFCIAVGFVILFTLICRFAAITEMNGELAAMNAQLEQLKDDNRKLQAGNQRQYQSGEHPPHCRRTAEYEMPDKLQRIP